MGSLMRKQVIIVGGGVIGAACAYFLSRRNVPALILERRYLASGCTSATAAMVNNFSTNPIPEPLRPFTFHGHRLIKELEADLELSLEISRGGTLILATNEQEFTDLKNLFDEVRQTGVNCEFFDGSTVRRMEPLLAACTMGAIYNPDSYHVNPFRLCEGYLNTALRRGSEIKYGIEVRKIKFRNDQVDCVITDQGQYEADYVIVAGGPYTPQILSESGVDIPITPARGQAIISEPCPPMLHHTLSFLPHMYAKQVANGNFYLGSSTEYVGYDTDITIEAISSYTRYLVKALPILARVKILRFFAGLRPMTADKLPILGPIPQCSRVILAAGHCSNGIRYSAITGKTIGQLILDGKTELPIDAFALNRFA
jgi:sarcosine oxidase subunit beta